MIIIDFSNYVSICNCVLNCGVRYVEISDTSSIAMTKLANKLITLPGIVPSVMSFGIFR